MTLKIIEAHTMGEPLRFIIDGIPEIKGSTMFEKQNYFEKHYDQYRKGVLLEPYGHKDMFGAVLTTKVHKEADIGVLFMNTEGMEQMCGHGSMAVSVIAAKYGLVKIKEPVTDIKLDVPAGIVTVTLEVRNGKVISTSLQNVASHYISEESIDIGLEHFITADIAYGGNVFAIVNADNLGLLISPDNTSRIIQTGMKIKTVLNEKKKYEDKAVLGTLLYSRNADNADYKDVVVFGNGSIDRSPCGTGCSAFISMLRRKKRIELHEEITVQSIVGTKFDVRIISEYQENGMLQYVPEIKGNAYIIGEGIRRFDENDPAKFGFLLQ